VQAAGTSSLVSVTLCPVHTSDKVEFYTFDFVAGDKVERVAFDFVA